MGYIDDLNDLDLSKLTPGQVTTAKLLAYRATSWAIHHAITKFTPEQQAKIHAAAFRNYLTKALAEVHAKEAAKDENANLAKVDIGGHLLFPPRGNKGTPVTDTGR